MSAQISKSQSKTPSSATKPTTTTATNSKYLKRAEVEAAREATYLAEQAARESERIAKGDKKRQLEEDAAEQKREREVKRQRLAEESKRRAAEEEEKKERERRKRIGLPDLPTATEKEEGDAEEGISLAEVGEDIEEEELIVKLRTLDEPARLFGETHAQRLNRYYRLQNPQTAVDAATKAAFTDGPIPTILEPVAEVDMKVPSSLPPETDLAARLLLARQLTSWFTLILKAWASALATRTEATKRTLTGQAAANSMTQALAHLTPLFRKLEKLPKDPSQLPDDLLEPMVEIVRAAQERRYVDANDGYLRLSIGKAAWPIGVTMVGIHERSAREKLHESDKGKAHIMSDEVTRKFLQSIKRCLSFAQTRWPPEDMGQLMG